MCESSRRKVKVGSSTFLLLCPFPNDASAVSLSPWRQKGTTTKTPWQQLVRNAVYVRYLRTLLAKLTTDDQDTVADVPLDVRSQGHRIVLGFYHQGRHLDFWALWREEQMNNLRRPLHSLYAVVMQQHQPNAIKHSIWYLLWAQPVIVWMVNQNCLVQQIYVLTSSMHVVASSYHCHNGHKAQHQSLSWGSWSCQHKFKSNLPISNLNDATWISRQLHVRNNNWAVFFTICCKWW